MPTRRLLLLSPAVLAFPAVHARPAGAGITWEQPVELARGKGVRGPWQQNDSRYDFVDDPAVVLQPDGAALTAWVDQARKSVFVQRRALDGRAMGAPAELTGPPGMFSWIPRLAVAPDAPGSAFLLWQEIIFSGGSHGGDMLLARSGDGARTFGAPLNISSSVGGDGKGRITPEYWHNGSYDLLAAAGGAVFAAWTEYDGPLWITQSSDSGRSFAQALMVAGGPGDKPARAPALALTRDGALLLAWTQGDNPSAAIHLARRPRDARAFGAPLRIATGTGYADGPRLAVDGRGTVHLAWAESEGGPFRRQRVLYARSVDGGQSFEAPRAIVAGLPAPYVSAGFPSLGVDPAGRVVVLAELYESVRERPRALGITVSRDGGGTFSAPELVPGSRDPGGGFNGSSQGLLIPKLALDASGRIAVVNSALREGSHSRVWLMRGRLG
jgi:hypothetical protein